MKIQEFIPLLLINTVPQIIRDPKASDSGARYGYLQLVVPITNNTKNTDSTKSSSKANLAFQHFFIDLESQTTDSLPQAVMKILKDANIKLRDIRYFAIITGPGPFTALRAGVAFLKGLSLTDKKKIIPINWMNVLAWKKIPSKFSQPFVILSPSNPKLELWYRKAFQNINDLVTQDKTSIWKDSNQAKDLDSKENETNFIKGDPPTADDIFNYLLEFIDILPKVNSEKLLPIYAKPPSITKPIKPTSLI